MARGGANVEQRVSQVRLASGVTPVACGGIRVWGSGGDDGGDAFCASVRSEPGPRVLRGEQAEVTVLELVDLLCDLPGFADVHTRAVILNELRPALVAGLRPGESTRAAAHAMVRHLLQWDGALQELADVLALFHGETPEITRLRLVVGRLAEPAGSLSGPGAELVRILRAAGHQPWLPSFLEVAGSAAESAPRSPAEAVAFLEELAVPPHQPTPVLRFAVALAARPGWSMPQEDALREWIHRLARRLGVTVPAAAEYRPDDPYGERSTGVRLVVSLRRYQPSSLDCLLSIWLGYGAERWIVLVLDDAPQPLDRIAARFDTFFQKAQELSGELPSRVEFLLPRSLLGLPVDRWYVNLHDHSMIGAGSPLGVLCPVVVRDLERSDNPRARERWVRRWREYEGSRDLSAERTAWLPCGREQDLPERALQRAVAVVVEPPPRHSRVPAGAVARAVGTALDAGFAVVLWGRDEGDADGHVESGALHSATRHLISGGSPARLPERITSLRRRALVDGAPSPAEQLALVWDDPGGRPDVGGGGLRCP